MTERNLVLRARVAALIAEGRSYAQIAREVGVSRARVSQLAKAMGYRRVTVRVPTR